jgi:hypothetical protein
MVPHARPTPPSRRARPALAAFAVLALLGLAACSAQGASGFSDLDREPSTADAIPASVSVEGTGAPTTARFVGEYEGTRLWLMETDRGLCLVMYPDGGDWLSSCTEPAGELGASGPGGDFVVIRDGGYPPPGAIRVSANVYAKS